MSDARRWADLRAANSDWLRPWDSTRPSSAAHGPIGFRAMTRQMRREARAGRALPFVVTYEGRMVGQVHVTGITWGSAWWASIGYWVSRDHAGRGITPTAVALVIDHCFAVVGLHRIEIAIRPENTASLRVVEKLHIQQVGAAPRYLHIDGAWRDHLLFAVTVEEAAGGMLSRLH